MTSSDTGGKAVRSPLPRLFVTAIVAAVLLWPGQAVTAQEQPCNGMGDYPCGYQLNDVRVQQGPAVFNFQARIAQTKLPSGATATFPVVVKLVSAGVVLCTETVDNVMVKGGILNVSIGRNISCELEEVLAENHNLHLQLCIGGPSSCLKPIALAVQPYAMKSLYAHEAMVADHANVAAQASYAHRATADREMFLRDELGAGYFDFYSRTASSASGFYTEQEFEPYADSGFIQWTPARSPSKTLHIAGRDADSGQLAFLDSLVLASDRSRMTGDLTIQALADGGGGLVVEGVGETVHIFGDSSVVGTLTVSGKTDAQELLYVAGNLLSEGGLTVGDQVTVSAGGLTVADGLHVTGELLLENDLTAHGLVSISGDADFASPVQIQNLSVTDSLDALGTTTIPEVSAETASFAGTLALNSLAVTEGVELQGNTTVAGQMEIGGEVLIQGTVLLNGGALNAGGDMRYVQAGGEVRELTWGGSVSFDGGMGMGSDLDLALHRAHEFSMQLSAGPPTECTEAVDGLFYLDTVADAMMLCSAGKYRKLGAAECGNGYVEPDEACDDNNIDGGDGCAADCTLELGFVCEGPAVQPTVCEAICNDGLIRGIEVCDDGPGGVGDSDGCAADCSALEPGWDCVGEPTVCDSICHDGLLRGAEDCDQGPDLAADGDGCAADCTEEEGFTCTDEPSDCQPWVCGDSVIDEPEECDDGNTEDGDGCSGDVCQVEDGWECEGLPSDCTSCGNGALFGDEECDDGNKEDADGCSAGCTVEPGWECNDAPSVCFEHGSIAFGHGQDNVFNMWQVFEVPAGVKEIRINVYGPNGTYLANWGGDYMGRGGSVHGTLAIEPGKNTLGIFCGGYAGGTGGSTTGNYSGGAGGPSVVTYPAQWSWPPVSPVLVAGAGGGYSNYQWTGPYRRGGHGGYPTGTKGQPNGNWQNSMYGGPGTQTKGGCACYHKNCDSSAVAGTYFQGGAGGYSTCTQITAGGGGGGGYYGGGGGTGGGGGGGGSSWYDTERITEFDHKTGTWSANGMVTISW